MDTGNIIMLCIMVVCIMLSAFFSSIETAFSTVSTVRLKHSAERGNKKAQNALKIVENYDKAITSILIGNNIVNIGCSSVATVLCINLFGDAGAAISTGAVTLLVLTFGEIIPKCIAKEKPEALCLATAKTLLILMTVLTPLVIFFVSLKTVALKLFNKGTAQPSVTEDELKVLIGTSQQEGVLEQQERELVQSALDFDEKTVQDILTPRVDITAININEKNDVIKQIILKERYSRIPVYKDGIDNIVGILYSRDYLEALLNTSKPDIKKLMKPAFFVYKTKILSEVLTEFKKEKLHIAVVTDDYGGTLGIVTMEDLLEEIVGDIWDEDEVEMPLYSKISDNTYYLSGDMNIYAMLELFGLREDYIVSDSISVGGWVMENMGDIPQPGDSFEYKNRLKFIVTEVTEQRVEKVKAIFQPQNDIK
ncbi:MAG: hemolysin family protein [Acutalibacteraceae bacterium]|nr:hemolysin family protein [Acutalibacteraceae bacterium]